MVPDEVIAEMKGELRGRSGVYRVKFGLGQQLFHLAGLLDAH